MSFAQIDSTHVANNPYQGGISNVISNYVTLQDTGSTATNAGPGGVTAIPPVKTYGSTDSLLVTIPVYGGVAVNVPTFGGADTPQYGTLNSAYGNLGTCNSSHVSF